jgi:hypothetical protein
VCDLRVCKNRMVRKVFRPKRYGVTGDWVRLHNEPATYVLCSTFNNVRMMRWPGQVT